MKSLETGIKKVRNVIHYTIGADSLEGLQTTIKKIRKNEGYIILFIDEFFENKEAIIKKIGALPTDVIKFVSTENEPTTDQIDSVINELRQTGFVSPSAIIGMGGGITMDIAKAVANLYTNPGKAEEYQGWDLVKNPAIYKIAIPTISGTGAEATRTCVMTNKRSGLKLGMNSDYTVYDQIIMDPLLTATVPRNQYFYTGMDAYIHCMESLSGQYRNGIGDAFSRETTNLCRKVFIGGDMMDDKNRELLMIASYLGGCAIATSYVGLVHPFSAGLSVVLGLHHCVANCIVMNAMEPYYPDGYAEFKKMAEEQNVKIPTGVCVGLDDEQYERLYQSTVIHEKPLTNALGERYLSILTRDRVKAIFQAM
jgi:3-deoxy-alpha-D-manno-octulosonate 8-oxidase